MKKVHPAKNPPPKYVGTPPLNKYNGPSLNGILHRACKGDLYPFLNSAGQV